MGISVSDIYWMRYAFDLATLSSGIKEIPTSALLVSGNVLIGKGWNKTISLLDPSCHAEIISIRQASFNTSNHRNITSTIYITNEPCIMCIGAIIQTRIKRVVFACKNLKNSLNFNTFCLLEEKKEFDKRVICSYLLTKRRCGEILKRFFKKRRFNENY